MNNSYSMDKECTKAENLAKMNHPRIVKYNDIWKEISDQSCYNQDAS